MTHINEVHGDDVQPFECAECNKTFKKPIELKYHEQTHNGTTLKTHSHLASMSAFAILKIIEAVVTKRKCKERVLYPFSTSMSISP